MLCSKLGPREEPVSSQCVSSGLMRAEKEQEHEDLGGLQL